MIGLLAYIEKNDTYEVEKLDPNPFAYAKSPKVSVKPSWGEMCFWLSPSA